MFRKCYTHFYIAGAVIRDDTTSNDRPSSSQFTQQEALKVTLDPDL
jgi:hypothetical protein